VPHVAAGSSASYTLLDTAVIGALCHPAPML
jgi:hypothetical protein